MHYKPNYKTWKVLGYTVSIIELKDLFKAWVALSFAFAILLGGFSFTSKLLVNFLIAGFTIGMAFLLHEFGHKLVAQKYGCQAEFRSFDQMLILAVIMSFFGFILAAPGAVMIQGHISKKQNGKISATGPAVNLGLAAMFLIASLFHNNIIFYYGLLINAWIGLFNLIPVWNFDGKKILAWNKVVYGAMVAAAFALVFGRTLIG